MVAARVLGLSLGLLLLAPQLALAAPQPNVSVTLKPEQTTVGKGDPFYLFLEVVTEGSARIDFNTTGLEGKPFAVAGQSDQSSTQVQITGAGMTTRKTVTRVFQVQPREEGTFTIGPAQVTVGGSAYQSNSVPMTVVPQGQAPQAQSGGPGAQGGAGGAGGRRRMRSPFGGLNPFDPFGDMDDPFEQAPVNPDDLFARTVIKRRNPYVGEGVLSTVYAYTAGPIQNFTPRKPAYDGFWEEPFEMPSEAVGEKQVIGNKAYTAYLVSRSMLFPLRPGKLTIPAVEIDIATGAGNALFRLGPTAVYRRTTEPVELEAQPLPTAGRPANFDPNAVGRFVLETDIDPADVQTATVGRPLTVRVRLSGIGNLRNIPVPTLPQSPNYKLYTPTVKDELGFVQTEFRGNRTAEALLVPLKAGAIEIPSVRLSYFDPDEGEYRETIAPARLLNVAEGQVPANIVAGVAPDPAVGAGAAGDKPSAKPGDKPDAGALAKFRLPIAPVSAPIVADPNRWIAIVPQALLAPPLAILLALLARWVARRRRESAPVRVHSMMLESLKVRGLQLTTASEPAEFLRFIVDAAEAVTGHEVRALTHDELTNLLATTRLMPTGARKVVEAMKVCEQARYAVGTAAGIDASVLAAVATLLEALDATTATPKGARLSRRLSQPGLWLLAGLAGALGLHAATARADEPAGDPAHDHARVAAQAYLDGRLDRAAQALEQLAAQSPTVGTATFNPDLEFNRALVFEGLKQPGLAALAYTRATVMGDDLARERRSLLARQLEKAEPRATGAEPFSLDEVTLRWGSGLLGPVALSAWAVLCLAAALWIASSRGPGQSFSLSRRSRALLMQTMGVALGVLVISAPLSLMFAWRATRSPLAVLVQPSAPGPDARPVVEVREGPNPGFPVAFEAVLGTEARVTATLDEFVAVEFSSGLTGWVPKASVAPVWPGAKGP
jgi:hypothetical protein